MAKTVALEVDATEDARVELVSLSTSPAALRPLSSHAGVQTLLLVVKATFDLAPRACSLSETQLPLHASDLHEGGDAARPVRAPSDFAPVKKGADVLLVGNAYPGSREQKTSFARLAIGRVDKTIRIVPDLRVPIQLPNMRQSLTAKPAPGCAGFGPARGQARAQGASFNDAPHDQRLAAILGDELLTLENLHPSYPSFATRIPSVRPCAFFERAGKLHEQVRMVCDTLWIDTDRFVMTLTWRGQLDVGETTAGARLLVALQHPQDELGFADIEGLAASTETYAEPSSRPLSSNGPVSSGVRGPASAGPRAHGRPTHWSAVDDLDESTGLFSAPLPDKIPSWVPAARAVSPSEPPTALAAPELALGAASSKRRAASSGTVPAVKSEALELLGLEPSVLAEARRTYTSSLRAREDDETEADRSDAFAILSNAPLVPLDELELAVRERLDPSRPYAPALFVAEGRVRLAFEDLDLLRELVLAMDASPAPGLEADALAFARDVIAAPSIRDVASALTRLRRGFAQDRLEELDAALERTLLERRSLKRRRYFGAPQVCCHLVTSNGALALPLYLTEAFADELPGVRSFAARVLVHVYPRQDQFERSAWSLRARAVARRLSLAVGAAPAPRATGTR